jgi:ABC-type antimicrobial peptide transport system permease subunit
MGMILEQVLVTTACGVGVGIPLTLGGARFIQGMIFGIPARDAGTVLVAVLILAAAAFIAGYLPARHAAGIDPVEALRSN